MCHATTILRLQTTFLVFALLAMFTTQVLAHGDHSSPCLGPHNNDDGCDGGAAPDPWHLVVEDSTGAFVGIPMEWNDPPWVANFEVHVAMPSPDGGSAILPRLTAQGIETTGSATYFTDSDCGRMSGTPYSKGTAGVGALVRSVFGGPDGLFFVVPEEQPVEFGVSLSSEWPGIGIGIGFGNGNVGTFDSDAQQLAPIGLDFTSPFSLEVRQAAP